jgi:mono/diheme cytochrome c family protein
MCGASRRRDAIAVLLACALAALAGCGGSSGGAKTAQTATRAATATTTAVSPAAIAAGQKVFAAKCALCHTIAGKVAHPKFIESPIPNLDEVRPKPDYVRARVMNGGFDMPSIGGELSAAQLSAVVAYVASIAGRDIGASEGTGDVALGRTVFAGNCARCHALAGRAATGRPEFPGTDFEQVRPSEKMIVARVTKGIREEMPSFRKTLTPAQIHAVAAYVSANAGR